MDSRIVTCIVPGLVLAASLCAPLDALAQEGGRGKAAQSERIENPQSLAHIDAAKKLAGDDPQLGIVWKFFCTVRDANQLGADIEATKVFDNLYAIPSSSWQQTTTWAIPTSEGIILLDSGEKGKTENVIAGLRKVGLDPAQVKYILLGHGHADHYGGAAYFQEHYATRVGTTAADWDYMFPPDKPLKPNDDRPHHDLVLKEGQPVTLGGETINIVEIPGHTPGSVGFFFKVTENGQTHTVGMFGGTIMGTGRIPTEGLNQYLHSVDHFLEIAKKMNVDVEIQNHAWFDDTPGRLARLKARKPGEPNPFLMSIDKYTKFWGVVSECIRAEISRRPDGK